MNRTIVIALVVVILMALAAAGGYLYGTRVGEARANAVRQAFFQERFGGQVGQGTGFFGTGGGQFPLGTPGPGGLGRGVTGEVTSVQGNTITLTTSDGPIQVSITEQTILRKVTDFSLDELQPGEQVVVIGDRDSQGNLVARSVQVGVGFRPGP